MILLLILSIFSPVIIKSEFVVSKNNISEDTLYFFNKFNKPLLLSDTVNNEKLIKVMLDDLPLSGDSNHPYLPVKPLRILLPQSTVIKTITVETSDVVLLHNDELVFCMCTVSLFFML